MPMFDNVTEFVKDDLKLEIKSECKVSIAAACFSIYAYQELKKQLSDISELRFIFTSPTFTTEHAPKEKREFYIPRLTRENTLCGSEFEIKLRNELTQKAIARECSDWIREKVKFKSNISGNFIPGFMNVDNGEKITYQPVNGFTTIDIGCERGNNSFNFVNKLDAPQSQKYLQMFNSLWNNAAQMQDVTDVVLDNITAAYKENAPEFIYFFTLYNIFNEFLEDVCDDELPNEGVGFRASEIWNKLYDFQKDAALAIINRLEKYNGCILADSVGLGKTFTALAVIKYYEDRNKNVLVLCPKKLSSNWNTFKGNYVNNPIAKDRLRYDVLYHTDLLRSRGESNGIELSRLRWDTYDLVVIDESHNFRNGGDSGLDGGKGNRYNRLMNKVIREGVKTKVLMLSATPVNNRFIDLKNQLALAYEGHAFNMEEKLDTQHSIDEIFRQAQKEFNAWNKLPPDSRTAEALLERLDFDFFELLDSVTIARSRRHIEKYYDAAAIGKFPERLKPLSPRPALTSRPNAINYKEIYETLQELTLKIYLPSTYIYDSARSKYDLPSLDPEDDERDSNLSQLGREKGIHRLMSIGLLKRLESSVYSFRLTLERIKALNEKTIRTISRYEQSGSADLFEFHEIMEDAELDAEEEDVDLFSVGKKVKIRLQDMDHDTWKKDLCKDVEILNLLISMIDEITPEYDNKLQNLLNQISDKVRNPINQGNKKLLIFTAFADTAEYLYKHVAPYVTKNFNLHTAMITGSGNGHSTIPKLPMEINTVLTLFSPISKEKTLLFPNNNVDIDILIATDCISEGQNLQDCDYLVNYDIHWNPVRIIQRFGRIDRIGSRNACIQLVNYWPDMELDDYIKLKDRVENRMKIVNMTATGDDDPINDDSGDLEYRRKQLERLQKEVVDLEEMNSGISIMDLGLNEFHLDLLDYVKKQGRCDHTPRGLHGVVPTSPDTPPGVIFILRNVNPGVNIDKQNRLHPFYMVYLRDDASVACHHLAPKRLLDTMRLLCKGRTEPLKDLCKAFNHETRDGLKMDHYSHLLGEAIASMIRKKKEADIDSLFHLGGTTALENDISGLNDFELICFLVVK